MTSGTAGGSTRGAAARLGMIEVAERLFAERGVHGVSLREIGAQAGQRNTAAARYHFGSKEALVDAVFKHRMEPINERRLAYLGRLDAAGRGHDLRGLVEAFLHPLAETLGTPGKPSWYVRFCVNAGLLEGIAVADLSAEEYTRGAAIVRDRLLTLFDDLPAPLRHDRWTLLAGYVGQTLAAREAFQQYGRADRLTARPVFLSHLLDTAVALAAAPVSPATTTTLKASGAVPPHPPRRTP
ncbi:TetR family transcriptional regulator [Yinghuangia sp. ASG 101]|uniref:TetR/AcrR family transcriptional regulator n=1 Tax=Yinghuangia sp. ASG 101 TaxID=2896848 RepID=UPI001E5438E4|nr:TetR/AcrR family transcriptional regulator [Yinghuangia sp. ASG 101]UGQ14758.1 TetR family transcriptional regulator [Yinghuangia sp. ASG 101]